MTMKDVMRTTAFLLIACFLALAGFGAAHSVTPNPSVLDELMPVPKMSAVVSDRMAPAERLQNATVIRKAVSGAPAATADEAYVLEIGEGGAKITAQSPFGEYWARVTLDQLVRLSPDGRVPCCRIVDWPRLKWRGFMLDTVRNYLPPDGVKDVIDMMSRYKLNLFHWHLTENYAWRLESKRFPELQSARAFLHRHKGRFYTQEEFKDIVDYAYQRGVRVMPEFDFPGHALAFRRAFGFKTMSDPGVAEKAAALFDELCDLAPKEKMPFIHMGTDEVWKRDVEGAPRETLELMAKTIADRGRTMVSWVPGEKYATPGPRVNMLWTSDVSPEKNPGAYFDAIGMYIEDFDPFELLSVAVYHKAARWHDAGDLNQGAIFCAWHDGFAGLPYENLLRNQPVFPSCVLFGDAYWRGRDTDLPQFRKRLPRAGDPLLAEAVEIERRVVAQRDRALCDIKHPFHFLRQTDMRWRLAQADGTLIAKDVAQATISPGREGCGVSNGTVVAETWIKSPKDQTVGAWIGFTNISRDHGLVYTAPLPKIGEWNRFGASIELNGQKIAPPKWKRPGLEKGEPIANWTPAWKLYEADEEPFTDQEYVMREPTQIRLRKGWNHVKLTMPNPSAKEKSKHRWVGTFIPVAGTTDHPHEVPDLEYSSEPPKSEGPLSPGGWNPVVRERLNDLIEKNRGKPDAYAVFDFDYTTAIGDLSYVCMWELLENFDIKVDDFHALIAEGMDQKYMDDIDEIGSLAAKLKPFVGQSLVDNPDWRKFSSLYWKFYRRLYVDVGDYDAYLWRSRVFAGYTPRELGDLAKRGIAKAIGRGCLWRDPTAPTEKRGIVFTPEIKELFRELRKAGIAVYVVSGSFQASLAVATGPDFGLDLDPNCVFGAEFKKDASGRYLPVMEEGCVKSGEKPSFIRSVIAPRHHGAEPILTAGDSMGDYKMLVEFDNLQLALVFVRRWKQPEMNELVARGGRVVAQGRDETRGCYIPELRCIEPPLIAIELGITNQESRTMNQEPRP